MTSIRTEFDTEAFLDAIKAKGESLLPAVISATRKGQLTYLGRVRDLLRKSSIVGLLRTWRDFPVESDGARIVGVVGSDHPAARMREVGHPGITPGKSPARSGPNKGQPTKALAIPLGKARTAQLKVARAGRAALPSGGNQFGPLSFRPIKGRTTKGIKGSDKVGLLLDTSGDAIFLLAKRVKVRGRHDAEKAVKEKQGEVRQIFFDEISKALEST